MADLMILAAHVAGEAAEHAGEHAEAVALGLGPGGWVALSMIALIAIMIYAGLPRMIAGALDKKIEGIKTMLDEAATLRKEAEALKKEYENKLKSADKHAAEMKDAAEAEAKLIVKKAKDDATALIARREKMAEEKIAAAERSAVGELRAKAADAAATAARRLIAEKHDADADRKLVDDSISSI
jgi:F-type H+-transporting ATPase subunit b